MEQVVTGEFDADRLREENYIPSTAPLKREVLPGHGLDEGLDVLSHWDLWLTLADRGVHGTYVPEVLFERIIEDSPLAQAEVDRVKREVMHKHGIT